MADRASIAPSGPEHDSFVPDRGVTTPTGAEVIVVGGGLAGASAAYHLARAGMHPLVLEARSGARGSLGHNVGLAAAGVDGHFEHATRIVKAAGGRSILDYTAHSLDMLEAWDAELPGGLGWKRAGSLHLALDDDEALHLRELGAAQRAEGLAVEVITRKSLGGLLPHMAVGEVRAAKWTPGDGTVDPARSTAALLEAVRSLGGTVVKGVRVKRIRVSGGRVGGVGTSHGDIDAALVLLAAGAGTPALAPHLSPGLARIQRTVCATESLPFRIGDPAFVTSRGARSWRQMPTGEIVIGGLVSVDSSSSEGPREAPRRLVDLLARLHPRMAGVRIVGHATTLLADSALGIPMAGGLPSESGVPLPGGYVLAGLGDHGHALAPILGRLVAELIADGEARTLPLAPFDPARHVGRAGTSPDERATAGR